MKIAVYAIAKDEERFADRWVDALEDADYIFVSDTGSKDRTPKFLRSRGVMVTHISIDPWRFDDARNAALALVPASVDVCVSLDLDEVIQPGWREELERIWTPNTGCVYHKIIAGWEFYNCRIHSRRGWRWKYPCHEGLYGSGDDSPGPSVTTSAIIVKHEPDDSKPRSSYLPLLQLGLRENPNDPRMLHYCGREYMYRGMYREAAELLERYLTLQSHFAAERALTAKYLAECWSRLS